MPYIGNQPAQIGAYAVESFNGGGSSFTLSKSATTETVLLFIDGVRQTPTDAYSVSGTTLTTTAATPSGTNNVTVQFLGDVVDFGEPSDNSVTSGKIVDGTIVNADINASAAIALSKLSTTGTADSTTFLRGDGAWATPTDLGKVLQTVSTSYSTTETTTSTSFVDSSLVATITPASASSKILIWVSSPWFGLHASNPSAEARIYNSTDAVTITEAHLEAYNSAGGTIYHSISCSMVGEDTGRSAATTYKVQHRATSAGRDSRLQQGNTKGWIILMEIAA